MVLVRLIRVKHWVKNLLVLFPLVFSGHLTDPASLIAAIAAFVAFSLGASSVYIFNDLRDIEADRNHPRKMNRPIASGKVPILAAIAIAAACLFLSFGTVVLLAVDLRVSLVILGIYITLNVGYSLGLKNLPVIDIAILASGFVFRVLFGGGMCGIQISSWLLLTILTLSVFLALGKRRGELSRHGSSMRKSLEAYSMGFLDKNLYMYLGISLVFYSLWTFERIGGFSSTLDAQAVVLIMGIPIVMMMCLRYTMDIEATDSDGDPMEVVFGHGKVETALLICALAWCVDMFVGLYLL